MTAFAEFRYLTVVLMCGLHRQPERISREVSNRYFTIRTIAIFKITM